MGEVAPGVAAPSESADGSDDSNGDELPGFGLLAGALAVLAAVALATRRTA